jgi:hypothetical protein
VQQSQRGGLDARTGPLVNRGMQMGAGGWSPGCFAWQMIASMTLLGSVKSGVLAVDSLQDVQEIATGCACQYFQGRCKRGQAAPECAAAIYRRGGNQALKPQDASLQD